MKPISRREFLSAAPRCLLAGTLGGGAVWLWHRSKGNRQTCTSNNGYCKQCSSNRSCGLPTAISFRKVINRRTNND